VITPDIIRSQFVERHADVLAEVLDCFDVRADSRDSVVAANELLRIRCISVVTEISFLCDNAILKQPECSGRPSRQQLDSSRLRCPVARVLDPITPIPEIWLDGSGSSRAIPHPWF